MPQASDPSFKDCLDYGARTCLKNKEKAKGEIAQEVKVFAAKPENLSSIHRTHISYGGRKESNPTRYPLTSTLSPTINRCFKKKKKKLGGGEHSEKP